MSHRLFKFFAKPANPSSTLRKLPGLLRRRAVVVALIVYSALFEVPAHADVTLTRLHNDAFATIQISGLISKSDVVRFESLVRILRPVIELIEVDLNSPGGDVNSALEIATLVRKEWLFTTVDDSDRHIQCASACVYIFAAGASRVAGSDSRIIIHRPYFDPQLFAKLQRNDARSKYDELTRQIQTFLARMGMSDTLFREMMKVPSSQGRVLNLAEMEAMNLVGKDPGYMEWMRARNVVKFGESSMKKFEAWLAHQNTFIDRCRRSGDPAEMIRCSKLFEATNPNPLFQKSTGK